MRARGPLWNNLSSLRLAHRRSAPWFQRPPPHVDNIFQAKLADYQLFLTEQLSATNCMLVLLSLKIKGTHGELPQRRVYRLWRRLWRWRTRHTHKCFHIVVFFNAPLTHGRAKSHFIDKHVVLYYESNLLHLLKKGKHNRGKTREIYFYFFLKLHIFRLSGGVSCWHLPYQKSMCPSRICSFRRSLPQLGTACNLHF